MTAGELKKALGEMAWADNIEVVVEIAGVQRPVVAVEDSEQPKGLLLLRVGQKCSCGTDHDPADAFTHNFYLATSKKPEECLACARAGGVRPRCVVCGGSGLVTT